MSPSRCQVCQLPAPIRKEVDRRLTSGSADGSGGKVSAWLAEQHKVEVKRTVLNEHRRNHLGVRPGVVGGKKKREESAPPPQAPPPPPAIEAPTSPVRPEVVQLDAVLTKLVGVATRFADHIDARLRIAETLHDVGLGEGTEGEAPAAPKKRTSLVSDAEASLMTGLAGNIERLTKARYLIAEGKLGRLAQESGSVGGLKGLLLDAHGKAAPPAMPPPLEGDMPDVSDEEMPGYEAADDTPAPTAADGVPVVEHDAAPPPQAPPPPSGSGIRPGAPAPALPAVGMAVGAGIALPWSSRG